MQAFLSQRIGHHAVLGGCWCCAVLADGSAKPARITGVKENTVIDTETEIEPRRALNGVGLKNVIAETDRGHIGH
ncbi:MAG: hypothetical protein KKD69_04990 [Euryarchaeota archaeon]|nr:hypothetical protein [Euryarchaeota archaeon]MCG2727127.1 hypothetical protein [Candidatus Methanoperedenaceae archaeon]